MIRGHGIRARVRHQLLQTARRALSDRGFYVLEKRYDLPIPDEDDLGRGFWASESKLVGVELNDEAALALARDVVASYRPEFAERFPLHATPDSRFHLINGAFMAVDAHVYYALIRHFQPGRVVEIGAGYSTLVAAEALARNAEDRGRRGDLAAIDPYPPSFLKDGVPGLGSLLVQKVQQADLDLFTTLASGDVLFIDSSHVLRSGGDVHYEYCEILPRLAGGVLVHVHDVSLPVPYPRVYFESGLYWNEQYVLQAFLTFNPRFEVLWPATYMARRHPGVVAELFPEVEDMRAVYPQAEPSSFWMRVRE